ncbi:hypothetical protein R5W24_005665 [Gemmata sp. JC717]|uniref:hypothetical protein n=1 Tax=Gemmata algarum TaxID=2975278 RepID=UPI0021BACC9E|nr:hypothetical protein [Gemmata algarum]MDY3556499.1 hypothetical protein [Gemmata algarum]
MKSLTRGEVVSASADGTAVDPACLGPLREDTLVLVSPELARPAVGDDAFVRLMDCGRTGTRFAP